jgi:hypothetical protein
MLLSRDIIIPKIVNLKIWKGTESTNFKSQINPSLDFLHPSSKPNEFKEMGSTDVSSPGLAPPVVTAQPQLQPQRTLANSGGPVNGVGHQTIQKAFKPDLNEHEHLICCCLFGMSVYCLILENMMD